MGRGPRAAADGCEAGLWPSDKGFGQMFAARCSQDGGSLGKISLLLHRPIPAAVRGGPRKRCGGCAHRQGQRGSGSRGLLRASLAEEFYLLCPATPTQPFYPLAVKYQKDVSGIWSERPTPM